MCLLGTDETEIYVYEKDGVRYRIIKNWESGNFAAFRSYEDGFDHIRLEDWDAIQEHINIWKGARFSILNSRSAIIRDMARCPQGLR